MDNTKNITKDSIQDLINSESKTIPAVTIYLPTSRYASPAHMSENEIRLKNILRKAEDVIVSRDDAKAFLPEFIDNIKQMLASESFLEKQTEGLLICARPGLFYSLHLAIDVDEYLSVSDQFHLAPVFGLIKDYSQYYVLVVAQHQPALYKGDNYGVYGTNVSLPLSLQDALKIDEANHDSEKQTSSYGATKGYNGRGGDKNIEDIDRLKFWRLIDQTVMSRTDRKIPLILAGIESEIVEYKEISKYPTILNDHIEGSYGGVKPHELFRKSYPLIIKDIIKPEHHQLIEEYKRLSGNSPNLVASDLKSILIAAREGRVEKLLLGLIRNTTDNVREGQDQLPLISFPSIEISQPLNEIAWTVWKSGGLVINIDHQLMPVKNGLFLAILRY